MATFSTTYNPDQRGPSGPVYRSTAKLAIRDPRQFKRHTLAGIDERAAPLGIRGACFAERRMRLLRESVAFLFGRSLGTLGEVRP